MKIQRSLMLNIAFSIPVCLFFIWIIYTYPFWILRIIVLLLLAFTAVMIASALRLLKGIAGVQLTNENLLAQLEFYHRNIRQWIRTQEKFGAFFYPVSITGGFLLGGTISSGKHMQELLSKPPLLIALATCWLLFTPLSIWLVRKMNHISYGQYLDQIQANIDELKVQ